MKAFTSMVIVLLVTVASSRAVYAEILEQGEAGFALSHVAEVAATPSALYMALTRDVGKWWDPEHTYSGDAKRLAMRARVGGCFCEKLKDGGAIEHMRVIYVQPREALRLSGALGPLQELGVTGTLSFSFQVLETASREGSLTRVEMRYGAGGFAEGGLQRWAEPVDRVLGTQLQRLLHYVVHGDPDSRMPL